MPRTRHLNLVVLHDLSSARAAIEEAAAGADSSEAPGLRQALHIIDTASHSDEDIKIQWARQYLEKAQVPAGDTSPQTIKALRQAAPELGLAEAVELVTLAAQR
ncbi:hypothetical protein M8I34_00845 [Streptomyces sp. MCA2]|uniref:hypothetical protein n=1 Tax=Streptomyces TaxID=1883 RepID=UPI002021DF0C|nr:hypothetical protein [Streptomyces sp. MCA2]MCL7490014.1 hypothetical protein [Streptomyces sp. MCA2]